jgi:hypothetical protein
MHQLNLFPLPNHYQVLFTSGTSEDQGALLGLLENLNIAIDHDGLSPHGYEISAVIEQVVLDEMPLPETTLVQIYDPAAGWIPYIS